MQDYINKVKASAKFIEDVLGYRPQVLVLSGTGLGDCVTFAQAPIVLPYKDIPHFPVSTVKGHKGEFAFGELDGKLVAVMRGRLHMYEGYSAKEAVYPVRVMQALGVSTMVITNAAGGLSDDILTGDVMIITDHLNLTGENPLIGEYNDYWGDMFVEMFNTYDPQLVKIGLVTGGNTFGSTVKTGVYAGLKGPSFETTAEVNWLRAIGGNAVGFSTVMEAIVGQQAKMRIFGISAITNSHSPYNRTSADLDDIIKIASSCAPKMEVIIKAVLAAI